MVLAVFRSAIQRFNTIGCALACAVLLCTFPANSIADSPEVEAVPGQYLIKFKYGSTSAARNRTAARLGAQSSNDVGPREELRLLKTPQNQDIDHEYAKQLLANGDVEYIEPNYIYSTNAVPNDVDFEKLWGMHNAGQTSGTADIDIDAPEAWNLNTGSNEIVVGVIDTGIDYNHEDLQSNMWVNTGEIPGDNIDNDGNGYIDDIHGINSAENSGDPMDDNGHGTHCAGTIGADGNNSTGVAGVTWNVKLMGLKFLDAGGRGTTADAITAINYAITMKQRGVNLKVLSNSWGGSGFSQALGDAIENANDEGILFVAAAGNNSRNNDQTPIYPANYESENVISVAALDHNGNLASYSNYGLQTVDVAAPGSDVYSTYKGNTYKSLSGTSMATPHVSGLLALLLSHDSSLSAAQARYRLETTLKPLSTVTSLIRLSGMVNAYNALTDTQTELPQPPAPINYTYISRDYTDVSDRGERVLLGDDEYHVMEIPFDLAFYGELYDRIAISTNGRIIPLGEGEDAPIYPDYSNSIKAGILPYHDDLYPPTNFAADSGVWVKNLQDRIVVSWVMTHYSLREVDSSEIVVRFHAVLRSNGVIEFHYEDTYTGGSHFDFGGSATVGTAPISSTGGGVSMQVSHNSASEALLAGGKGITVRRSGGVKNDFDGDGKSDLVVWRPSFGMWFIRYSASGYNPANDTMLQFGLPDDEPLIGDFDGDGKPDLGVYRKEYGVWIYTTAASGFTEVFYVQWGLSTDLPSAGDFDGDGKTDPAVFRPSTGEFYSLNSSVSSNSQSALSGNQAAYSKVSLGGMHHDVVVGDFDGNGSDDFTTVWQVQRYWTAKTSSGQTIFSLPWGSPGDTPLACKYDSNSVADRVVTRINSNNMMEWYIASDQGPVYTHTFGSLGDIPSCDKDFDGDEYVDIAVYRPSTGEWFIRSSKTGEISVHSFGLPGDVNF